MHRYQLVAIDIMCCGFFNRFTGAVSSVTLSALLWCPLGAHHIVIAISMQTLHPTNQKFLLKNFYLSGLFLLVSESKSSIRFLTIDTLKMAGIISKVLGSSKSNNISFCLDIDHLVILKTFNYTSVDSYSDSESVQPQIKRESNSFFATIIDYHRLRCSNGKKRVTDTNIQSSTSCKAEAAKYLQRKHIYGVSRHPMRHSLQIQEISGNTCRP